MTSKVLNAPKLLASGEGQSFQLVNLLFTEKVNEGNTHNDWVMHEISGHADEGAPLHSHPWYETFYVLEGEIDVQVGNRRAVVTPGMLMHVPENVAHRFRICSPTARMLEIIPVAAAAFYRETGANVPTISSDMELFRSLCIKHGVRLF